MLDMEDGSGMMGPHMVEPTDLPQVRVGWEHGPSVTHLHLFLVIRVPYCPG